jgi:bleomycin hydrolase
VPAVFAFDGIAIASVGSQYDRGFQMARFWPAFKTLIRVPLFTRKTKNMRNYLVVFALALAFPSSTFGQSSAEFEVVTHVKSTPLKDQQSSGTCWSFATTSFIETEAIRLGKDPVVLSPMYYVAPAYRNKAEKFIQRKGQSYFGAGDLTFSVLDAYQQSGAVPESIYDGIIEGDRQHDHREMDRLLAAMVKSVGASGYGRIKPDSWRKSVDDVLKAYLGDPPEHFTYKGEQHTPESFATKFVGINVDEYVEITSFSHHEFFERCVLDIPANWNKKAYLNLPIQEFEQVIVSALENGFSLAWDGDASEPGFDFKSGVMKLPAVQEDSVITQAIRQSAFEDKTTTDDHNTHIVGIAKDPQGKTFFVMKNSEGDNEAEGHIYMSSNALLLKTISVLVHQDAISADIKSKTYLDNSELMVSYLDKTPTIDGKLDADLTHLVEKQFNKIRTLDNPEMSPVKVTYRMGYTPSHFYLYIETDADKVTYHRRGYLWGDGYKLLLGIPQADAKKDGLTDEYYVMAFSPTIEEDYQWGKQGIESYNFTGGKSFSDKTQSQEWSGNGKSGFEALIAWSDIRPYHPWFTKELGYNLYFAKGFETKEHGHFPYGYVVVDDEAVWDEEIERRGYVPFSFERPASVESQTVLVQAELGHISIGESLGLNVVSLGPTPDQVTLKVKLLNASGKQVLEQAAEINVANSLQEATVTIDTASLGTGNYTLSAEVEGHTSKTEISILPSFKFDELREPLELNENRVTDGAVHTLMFKLKTLEQDLAKLKPYDTASDILDYWADLENEFAIFQKGKDPYAGRTGPYRRAFKSKHDRSYQPYSIRLPDDYDPAKTYPLLVFMHGSGQDEQYLLNSVRSNGKFIELAPYGRDRFRAYASEESQIDIVEAIEAASAAFSVDKEKVIMGGFSMGGYGALRAYYEHPELYQGVAVFAGHPNLPSEWLEEEHPNFLDEKYLKTFVGKPVFIYHGGKDAALDVNLIKEMSLKLEKIGAIVTKSFPSENGHEYQDAKTQELYSDWLDKLAAVFIRDYSANKGPEDAKVTVVEFLDPECTSCRSFHPFVKGILSEHTDKVRLVVRYRPSHSNSKFVVRILEAARMQGKYWEALDVIFKYQPQWGSHDNPQPELLWEVLPEANVDIEQIKKDMGAQEITAILEQDVTDSRALEIKAAPTFFVNGKPLPSFGKDQLNAAITEAVNQ